MDLFAWAKKEGYKWNVSYKQGNTNLCLNLQLVLLFRHAIMNIHLSTIGLNLLALMKYIKLNLITAKCLLCTHVSPLCVGNYATTIENPNPNVTLNTIPEVYTKDNGNYRSWICTLPRSPV